MATVGARKLVIVVDDELGVLKGIGRLLKARGFDSELFSSVKDFQNRASLQLAVCLVLDINLNGESGIDIRRKLTATWPSVPAIFITGNDSAAARKAAMEAGCIAYLTKPFSANSLLDAIEKASARRHYPSSAMRPASGRPRSAQGRWR
jgi:FixJ family two-component response regulator